MYLLWAAWNYVLRLDRPKALVPGALSHRPKPTAGGFLSWIVVGCFLRDLSLNEHSLWGLRLVQNKEPISRRVVLVNHIVYHEYVYTR